MTSPGRHAPADAAPDTAERHPIVETARVGAPLDGPGIKHECGVFGIWAPGADVARLTFFALYALQHRGQESAGIATTDGKSVFVHRGLGLVTQAFDDEAHLRPLVGDTAIGHCRYSTRGANSLRNAQPFVLQTLHGPLGVAHNGNITNAHALRRDLLERGIGLSTASDSELLLQHLAFTGADPTRAATDWPARLRRLLHDAEGAYSLAVLTREGIYAIRDPHGFRPLCIGELPLDDGRTGYIIASESCALGPIGARHLRDVQPGEIVRVGADGIQSWPGVEATPEPAFCVFEYVYFARPDSDFEGRSVHLVRQRYGERLALEAPADADVVVGVPDSALPPPSATPAKAASPTSRGSPRTATSAAPSSSPTPASAATRCASSTPRCAPTSKASASCSSMTPSCAAAPPARSCASCAKAAPPRCTSASAHPRCATPASWASTSAPTSRSSPTRGRSKRSASTSAPTASPTSRSKA
ncbi:MAG: hypothetical protein R3F65_19970 [bacterium]